MTAPARKYRYATADEIKELEEIALQEHTSLGIEQPSGLTINTRVRSLAGQNGLLVPGLSQAPEPSRQRRARKNPNYLGASLEQKGQQCAKERRQKRLQKHIRIVRENSDRFYLFCFLKGDFAKAMRKCRALEVLAGIIEQLSGDVETWVSIETLAARLGRTAKTVSKALRELEAKRIVSVTDAATRDFSLHGKPITKNQGYIIQLHPPMFWDWNSIGGVPEKMKKYLADYDDEPVDNSETPVTVTGVPR